MAQFSRTRRIAIAGMALCVLGAIAVWLATAATRGTAAPAIGGPFTLTAADGRAVSDADFRGRYMLVYFGYTHCPDACPTALTAISNALDTLGPDAARVTPVFITVDPARDTPAVMADYDANFAKSLVGLTGSPEQIAKVAGEYRVYYSPHRAADDHGDYTIDHSSVLYLMGPDGKLAALLDPTEDADKLAADLRGKLGASG